MDIKEITAKKTKEFIASRLHCIKSEEKLIQALEIFKKRSEDTIATSRKEVWNMVGSVSGDVIDWSNPLGKFLHTKPRMPHENYESCHVVFVEILTNILTSSLQYGKTTRGGVDQIQFVGSQEGAKVWAEIEEDFKKVCTEFFDITPFLDTEKENFPAIGFYMNSKWEEKDGRIVQKKD